MASAGASLATDLSAALRLPRARERRRDARRRVPAARPSPRVDGRLGLVGSCRDRRLPPQRARRRHAWAFAVSSAQPRSSPAWCLRGDDPAPHATPGSGPKDRPGGDSSFPSPIGLVGGLLAVRASIEPVTEWDAAIYHVSFARDWIASLPGLPHAAGPSVGAELSYNYPALFPSISVVLAGALHVGVGTVARLVSPLAAITVLAVLRTVGPSAALRRLGGADVPPRQHLVRRVRRMADRLHADDRADRSRGRAASWSRGG